MSQRRVELRDVELLARLCEEALSVEPAAAEEDTLVLCRFEQPAKKRKRAAEPPQGSAAARSRAPNPQSFNTFSASKRGLRASDVPALLAARSATVRERVRHHAETEEAAGRSPPTVGAATSAQTGAGASTDGAAAVVSGGDGDGKADGASGGGCVALRDVSVAEWRDGEEVSVRNVCSYLAARPEYRAQLVYARTAPPRAGRYVSLAEAPLPDAVAAALRAHGINRLFSHQAEALRALAAGRHVMLATPTSSGKSLVYSAPTVATVLQDPHARA
eukprot:4601431-Prymnesium_polylepis.1